MIAYPSLALGGFVVAWILGELGRHVDRRLRLDTADVVRIEAGFAAAARDDLTEDVLVVDDPLPGFFDGKPMHTCAPPGWYVAVLDRPDEFDRIIGVEFPGPAFDAYAEEAT